MSQWFRRPAAAPAAAAPELLRLPLRGGRQPAPRNWQTVLPLLLALAALWLLNNPWQGFWHDSQMYAVQALRVLLPDQFRHDLYFLYGSQDRFTIFSPLYAAWIAAFGLVTGAKLLYAAGSVLWLAAAAFLASCFLRGFYFWLGLVLLVLLPSDYGPMAGVITIRESFLTPRLFAEALSMLALAFTLRGRWRLAFAMLALSLLLHPLMTLGAMLVALLYHGRGEPRQVLLVASVAGALLLCAAILGIAPFDRILVTMDAEWLQKVLQFAPPVAWDGWHAFEWVGRTTVTFCLVLAAAWLSRGATSRFFGCIATAGALGLLASWIGTGLAHNLLAMQVQPSRVLWLLHLGADVALAWLLAAFWQHGRTARVLLLLLATAMLLRNSFGYALALPGTFALCLLARQSAPQDIPARTYRLALAGVLLLACCWLREVQLLADGHKAASYGSELALFVWLAFKSGGGALLGAGLLWCLWRCRTRGRTVDHMLAWALVTASLAAAALWSQQREAAAQTMSPLARQAVQQFFLPRIPPQAVVYWENDVRATWFLLQRSNYAASTQVVGAVFNRGTAMEGARRMERLEQLGMYDAVLHHDPRRLAQLQRDLPRPSIAGLSHVCDDPVLDFVVLSRPLGDAVVERVHDAAFQRSYFLHDCARVRGAERGGA